MSLDSTNSPDHTFDGGSMEINADKIEARLGSIWKQASATLGSAMPVAKLCLANMIVVTNRQSRLDAERATFELATLHPSRVILLMIHEDTRKYSAYVRTSCSRDVETGITRCWEVVELEADVSQLERLPGALRSLLVGSVPVVSIDFRPFQTTPRLDAVIMDLSDFYFINADVVPSNGLKKTYLPFRWYRTLVIRELLGELVSRVLSLDCTLRPERFETFASERQDTYGDLLTGWLLHRLEDHKPTQSGSTITAHSRGATVMLDQLRYSGNEPILRIHFSSGEIGEIRQVRDGESGAVVYQAKYKDIIVERDAGAIRLSRYVIETLRDRSEFTEFASANEALDRIVQQ